MNTYKLFYNETEPSIVGVKDGLGQGFLDDDFYSTNPKFKDIFIKNEKWSIDWWKRWQLWKEYGQDLQRIKLEKLAKLTDIISVSRLLVGIIVNERVQNILKEFNLPSHYYFNVTLIKNGKLIEGYKWLCFDLDTGENTVNFTKSDYFFDKYMDKEFEYIKNTQIHSYEDYMSIFYKTGKALTVTNMTLNKNFNSDLDLWGTQFLTMETYISERLIKAFEKHNITGFQYRDDIYDLIIE